MYTIANEKYMPFVETCLNNHEDLKRIKSAYEAGALHIQLMECDKAKRVNKSMIYADCQKLSQKMSTLTGTHFVITYYADSETLNEKGIEILTWHELKHIGIDDEGRFYIADHDLQDFKAVVERYGVDWEEKYTN